MRNRTFRWHPCKVMLSAGAAFVLLTIAVHASQTDSGSAGQYARATKDRTALDEYVAAPDPNYTFSVTNTIAGREYTTYVLNLVSQSWLTTNEVDRPLWQHWLVLVKPKEVTSSKALLFISGGANGRSPPASADQNWVQIAMATKSVVAELKMVPNLFLNDTANT